MLVKLALAAAALYLVSAALLYVAQRRLIYFPDSTRYTPEQAGLAGVTQAFLDTPDGQRLIVWRSAAKGGAPTLLYFTGNAGGLINRRERIQLFRSAGYGLFMVAYRGYAGSTGSPSETALVADGVLAYDRLLASGLSHDNIVIYGESLGTGVACQVAARRPAAGLILEAPFTSLADAASHHYRLYPVRRLLFDTYDSQAVIGRISAPLLIIHGEQDWIVPIELGRKLFEAAKEPKTFVALPQAGHNDSFEFGAMDHVRLFLQQRFR